MSDNLQLSRKDFYWKGEFTAMACPCEVLVATNDESLAQNILTTVQQEALRIEHKFSRYRDDNIVYRINNANGEPVEVDEETARLLDFADQCYQLSDGKFDITAGILRRAWTFDCSDRLPDPADITPLLQKVGWQKVTWQKPYIQMSTGMEIDFGE